MNTGYSDAGYRIQDTGYMNTGYSDTGYRIQDTGYRIQGYRIHDTRL